MVVMVVSRAEAVSVVSTLEVRAPCFTTHAAERIGGAPHVNLASFLLRYKNVNLSDLIVLQNGN